MGPAGRGRAVRARALGARRARRAAVADELPADDRDGRGAGAPARHRGLLERRREHAAGLGARPRARDPARRPRRDPRRLEPARLSRAARADRVPAPDPVGRADPARRARLRHRPGEQGLPRRLRLLLAAVRADALRRAGRRPRRDRHGALVRARPLRADLADPAPRRRALHRHRRADLLRRRADPLRHRRARDRLGRARALDQRRAVGRRDRRHVRADHRHRDPRLAAEHPRHARRAARPALAPVAAGAARMRRRLELALEIAVPIALLVLWGVLSASGDTFYFPPLTDILEKFRELWLFDRVGSDVLPSLERLFLGYAIACIVAVAVGIPPALLPFAVVVLGVGNTGKVFLIAFVCLWPVLLNTIDGVTGIDPTLRETVRSYGVSGRDRLLRIVLPAASPQ